MRTSGAAIIAALLVVPHPSCSAGVHATKGVVQFVDANTLVIARSPRAGLEMTFVMTPSTECVGDVNVGSTVDVRYRSDAKRKTATAVTVEPDRLPPSAANAREREE